jgi:hypothetical protein
MVALEGCAAEAAYLQNIIRGFWQIRNGSLMGTANGYEISRLTVAA